MGRMSGVSRVAWIAVSLLALTAPMVALCGMPGEPGQPMESCAMAAPHDMESCWDAIALSMSCCDPGAVGAATEVVLNRLDEIAGSPAAGCWATPCSSDVEAARRLLPDRSPPPGPAPYRLFSALLL